jgi:putative spermidine/putrescine transport system permease protein
LTWLLVYPPHGLLRGHNFIGRQALMALINLPLAIPGIAIALALILAYPAARASGLLLLLGHVIYTLPFLVATLVPALAQAALIEREAVACTLGASAMQRLWYVTLPSIRSALLGCFDFGVHAVHGGVQCLVLLVHPSEQNAAHRVVLGIHHQPGGSGGGDYSHFSLLRRACCHRH